MFPQSPIPNSKLSSHFVRKGFTLVELLVYSVLFVVAGGLVTGIALNIKKNVDINESQKTVDAIFNDLETKLGAAIENSVAVNSVANGSISLAAADSENENYFSLSNNSVYYKAGTDSLSAITGSEVKVDTLNFRLTPSQNVGIDPINHWAYNDIFGWIDFGQNGNSIKIPTSAGDLTGVAWGKGTGYIFLNCLSTDNCSTSNYKVSSDQLGNLSGYAWSESMGWISFCGNSGGTGGCAPSSINYGVTIDQSTGEFSGQAWSEVAGYISFNCLTGGSSGTNVCSTSNYKVQDLRRKTTAVTVDIKISYNIAPYQSTFRSGSVTFNLKQPSKVTVTAISPASGSGVISNITVNGTYFKAGALVKLTKSGSKDVYPSTNFIQSSSSVLSGGVIDTTYAPAGTWDVMVINPDGQIGILKNGFTVNTLTTTTTTTTTTSTSTSTTTTTTTLPACSDYCIQQKPGDCMSTCGTPSCPIGYTSYLVTTTDCGSNACCCKAPVYPEPCMN